MRLLLISPWSGSQLCRHQPSLNNMEEKQYGFIYEPGTDQDYVLGGEVSLGGEVLMPNGHGWGNFLPEVEIQNANNIETYACTSFGTLSAFEILGRKYGLNFNFSDRHSAITSGTDPYRSEEHTSEL